jgi:plasmid stabilization system protein ParE
MKVVYTAEALKDLEDIASYIATHYPAIAPAVRQRLGAAMTHIAHWPQGARAAEGRAGVRVISLRKYPYKIFYRIRGDVVEVLHIHHAARNPWAD